MFDRLEDSPRPVTGVFLSHPFLLAGAFLVAWTVDARKRTKVVRA